jgi:hypothetical protein
MGTIPLVVGECAKQENIEPAANIERRDNDSLVDFLRSRAAPVIIIAGMGQPVEVVGRHLLQYRHIYKWEPIVQGGDVAKSMKRLAQVFRCYLARLESALLFGQSGAQRPHQDKAQLKCSALIRLTLVVVCAGNGRHHRQQCLWRFSCG